MIFEPEERKRLEATMRPKIGKAVFEARKTLEKAYSELTIPFDTSARQKAIFTSMMLGFTVTMYSEMPELMPIKAYGLDPVTHLQLEEMIQKINDVAKLASVINSKIGEPA